MSRPRLTGVRRLNEIARDDPARGRVVTLVSGMVHFPDREVTTRESVLGALEGRLARRYGTGAIAVQIEDHLHQAGFVFTPEA